MEPLQREPLGAQEVQAACESVTADGINALSNFVDSRVQWVMPDKWIWIPGVCL
jgi:sarcosine oxidase gamma subunit